MIKLTLVLPLLLIQSISISYADVRLNDKVEVILKKIEKLNTQKGTLTSSIAGKSGRECTINVTRFPDTNGVLIKLDDVSIDTPYAFMTKESVVFGDSILVTSKSHRIGGDVCGDFGGAFNYKQFVEYNEDARGKKTVTIKASYFCPLSSLRTQYSFSSCKI